MADTDRGLGNVVQKAMEELEDAKKEETKQENTEEKVEENQTQETQEETQEEQYEEVTEIDPNALNETIDTLKGELERTKKDNQLLADRLQLILNNQQQQQPQQSEDNSSQELPPDFDTMSQRELVEFMIKEVNKNIQNQITPVKEQLTMTEQERKIQTAKQDIAQTAKKYPDFNNYIPQMEQIAKQTQGTLNAEQVYLLAKQQAVNTGVNYRNNQSNFVRRKKRKVAPSTEKPTATSQTSRQESFSRQEAFEEAWNRVMAGRNEE